ncbi:hypothetical protein TRVA0_060S00650 [Trichomonascus vanleenenianus]|uniref:Snm1p n=1 Tax=Trichomonascus vanleenenianus TaxID=2268995 RepID=UPI003ECB7C68
MAASQQKALHLYKAAKCTVNESPELASAYQSRSLGVFSAPNLGLTLPQQTQTHACPHCSVPWVPGWTVSMAIKFNNSITRTKGGSNKRQRLKKRKMGDPRRKVMAFTCRACHTVAWTELANPFIIISNQPNAAVSSLMGSQGDTIDTKLGGSSAKKRAKNRKKLSSLQQMVAKSKEAKQSNKLSIADFLDPSS